MQHTTSNDIFFKILYKKFVGKMSFNVAKHTLPNVNNCKCSSSPDKSYLVYWNQYSTAYIYEFKNQASPPTYKGKLQSGLSIPNLTQTISFSSDGEYFILEADAQIPVSIVSLSPSAFLSKRSFRFNGTINRALFLDSANKFIAIFNDSALTLI